MIVQKWHVELEDNSHEVEYRYSKLSGKTTLVLNSEEFTVKGKIFGIGVRRSEPIIVGSVQGVLNIDRSGRAKLIVREAVSVSERK